MHILASRKRFSRKIAFALLLLAVLTVFFLNLFRQQRAVVSDTVEYFFSAVTAGDEAEAVKFLSSEVGDQDSLLGVLSTPGLFRLSSVSAPRFLSLSRAELTIHIEVKGEPYQTEVQLVRVDNNWKIASFPRLELSEAAYVLNVSGESVTLLDGTGNIKEFALAQYIPSTGQVGLAVGIEGRLHYFSPWEEVVLNKLLTVSGSILEGEKLGFFKLADNTALFRRDSSGVRAATGRELIVGMTEVTLFTGNNLVHAVLMPADFIPGSIRVALNTTGFAGTSHNSARLSADTAYTLEDRVAGRSFSISAGRQLNFSPQGDGVAVTFPSGETQVFTNRLFILAQADSKIKVDSIRRGSPEFTPSYRGHLEIRAAGGSLLIVNEVSLEEYLYTVVPSEMPVSFGLEALKVQAVAARSYAVSSIAQSGLRSLSAHVDDSTASQVYNNIREINLSNQAVRNTTGLVAVYNGKIIDARFFSTSSGVTANFQEVWHDRDSGAFPASPLPYLVSRSQLRSGSLPDVATEAGARSFFMSAHHDTYDTASPWFRWQVTMSRRELEASIEHNLARQHKAQPAFILTLEGNEFISKPIDSDPIGSLLDLRVIRRGGGGNIMELEIVGKNGTYRVLKELNIRFTLRPVKYPVGSGKVALVRHDGSVLNNYALLPSAYMVPDINRDSKGAILNIVFYGGGNGHGVGMSQWGARGLAANGKNFREILSHFYPGSELTSIKDVSL
jgi:stage II sporulation protein D